jgi:excisionase family DNA binding protein
VKETEGLNSEDRMRVEEASQELFLKGLLERLVDSLERSKRTEVLVHTIDEAAAILKVKRSTIENLIHRTRELSSCKAGRELRIRDEDLKRFLAGRARPCVDDTRSMP